jgi:cysteine synthase A
MSEPRAPILIGPDKSERWVVVSEGVISDVGDRGRTLPKAEDIPRLRLGEALLHPGFVNAHTHIYSGLAPFGMPNPEVPPQNFVEILERVWWPLDRALDADTLRAAARLYVAEALLDGTTTLVDHHESPGLIEGSLDILADACAELGVRAVLTYGATERNGGREEALRGLAECARFLAGNRRPLVRGAVGLHASFTVSDATLVDAARMCADYDAVMHVHLAEDAADVRDAQARGFSGVVERLLGSGALPPGSICAHGVHLSPDEVEVLADAHVWLVQNPRSNANNGVGYPGHLWRSHLVALGTDGFPADMHSELGALRAHAASHGDKTDAVERRLSNGRMLVAERFGRSLEVTERGAAADLVVSLHGQVQHVMVGGRWVVRDGHLVNADLAAIRNEAAAAAERLWSRMKDKKGGYEHRPVPGVLSDSPRTAAAGGDTPSTVAAVGNDVGTNKGFRRTGSVPKLELRFSTGSHRPTGAPVDGTARNAADGRGAAPGPVAAPRGAAFLGLEHEVVDREVYARTVKHFRKLGIRLPTLGELIDPSRVPLDIEAALPEISPDIAEPLNLFRVHWYNAANRRLRAEVPEHIVLPKSLTGVSARIVVALGNTFPMIGAHKVLAAYACLVPRLVTGQFDPSTHRAVWPSTGNYCRGGVAISRILGCRGVAVLPEGMSLERFEWLESWVTKPSDIIRTPGTESNVKEIYDKCAELKQNSDNVILNQFCEFGNHLVHRAATGRALEHVFEHLRASEPRLRLRAFVSATGSAGTIGAGDHLAERFGSLTVAVEALECPTLLYNGFGEHNIQGIGDKHVPLIHNVMGTDIVTAVSDQATDRLALLFNTQLGQTYLSERRGVDEAVVARLSALGYSSICNVLAAIKTARYLNLGADDVIVTVATDGAAMYGAERQAILERDFGGEFDAIRAGETFGQYLLGAATDHLQELTLRDRERIFNLGYYTWVEQQGVSLADFEARRRPEFWRGLASLIPAWDAAIERFNEETGATGRR